MLSFIFAEVHTHEEVINVTMYCNLTYLLRRVEDVTCNITSKSIKLMIIKINYLIIIQSYITLS